MDTVQIKAIPRLGRGKGAARKERQKGLVPAVLYGNGHSTQTFAFDPTTLERTIDRGPGRNALFEIDLGESKSLAVLREMQRHPINPGLLHVDFYAVKADGEVDLQVPVLLDGTPAGVKLGGKLSRHLRVATLRCPVSALVAELRVDISGLGLGQKASLSDLTPPAGTRIISRHNLPVVSITSAAVMLEDEDEDEAEEGAAPAEGADA